MTRWTMSQRGAPVVAALLLTVIGGSCKSGGGSYEIGTQRYTGEVEDEVPGLAPSQLGGPLGGGRGTPLQDRPTPALTQAFDSMSDRDLVDYLRKLQYNMDTNIGQVVDAQCVHADSARKDCAPTEAARVFIEPEVGMNKWEHDAIPEHGLVVARIINYDPSDRQETTFGFPRSTRVWWVVDYDAQHQLRSRFFKRNYNATGPAVDQVGAPRGFHRCKHLDKPAPLARAKFWNCAQSAQALAPSTSRGDQVVGSHSSAAATPAQLTSFGSAVPLPARPMSELLRDSWVNCGAGCCATSP